jgi:hypothetical protein
MVQTIGKEIVPVSIKKELVNVDLLVGFHIVTVPPPRNLKIHNRLATIEQRAAEVGDNVRIYEEVVEIGRAHV